MSRFLWFTVYIRFRRRDVTTRSRGGGRRWYKQLPGWQIFLKKPLKWSLLCG